MRRQRLLCPLVAALAATPLFAADRPTADEIVANHVAARGGAAAIAAVRTVVYSQGTYREPGYEGSGNAFMALARPYFKVVGNPESRSGFSEGYDGATWEWFENPGIVIRTVGEASAAGRHGAWVDGMLIDYRAKGSTVEVGELTPIDDRNAWQLTLTARDGFRVDYFVDVETWLVIAERMAAPIHAWGEPVTRETRVSDYREVGGVLFPHRYSETDIATGEMVSEMQWGSIEVNRDLPAWWFEPPAPEPGTDRTLPTFLEHLYFQRTDAEAVLWSYSEFRRAHPEIDTHAGVQLIGYQMLKMGDVGTAVRLLEQDAADYPEAASGAFGLARAYAKAGDRNAARRAYERALELDPEHRRARQALAALN
jgi:hypothetical protein